MGMTLTVRAHAERAFMSTFMRAFMGAIALAGIIGTLAGCASLGIREM